MFLSDFTIYSKIANNNRITTKFRDENDPEVDRLYNTSPNITESSTTYEMEGMYKLEVEDIELKINEASKLRTKAQPPVNPPGWKPSPPPILVDSAEVAAKLAQNADPSKPALSGLSKMFAEYEAKLAIAGSEKGKIPLIIYLPDCSPLRIVAKDTCDFREVISIVLSTHKEQGVQPPLDYANPRNYELRIHEGDGEPDRDFPPLDLNKKLKNFNLEDYCLCEIDEFNRGSNDSDEILMGGIQPPPPVMRDRKSTAVIEPSGGDEFGRLSLFRAGSAKIATPRNRRQSLDDEPASSEEDNFVTITFPGGSTLDLMHEEDTTFIQLLPMIVKTYRIRLITDEYVFVMSQKDQQRLKLAYPHVDMHHRVKSVGVKAFEIQKKLYADTPKVVQPKTQPPAEKRRERNTSQMNMDNIVFNEASANAYQEWNVVKKNKFGRRQERVFGVDGKKVYNSKRGQYRGGVATGVHRAERDIGTIVKNEILPNDPKTFRITWLDDKDIYNIEYSCETERECAEIVSKIKYILSKLRVKR